MRERAARRRLIDVEGLWALLAAAPGDFVTARVVVRHWADWRAYRESLGRFPSNPRAVSILSSPRADFSSEQEMQWRAWIQVPDRHRVDHFSPSDRLHDASGATGATRWFLTPGEGVIRLVEDRPAGGEGDPSVGRYLRERVHPAVSELLCPTFLWEEPEGATGSVDLAPQGTASWLGREAVEVSMSVPDWRTRDAAWSDSLWVADRYRVLVDLERGVLLRAASILRDREFVVREVRHLAFDEPIPAAVFDPPGANPNGPKS